MVSCIDISRTSTAETAHFTGLMREFSRLGFEVRAILPRSRYVAPQELDINEDIELIWTPNPPESRFMKMARFPLQLPAIVKQLFTFSPSWIYLRYMALASLQLFVIRLLRNFPRFADLKIILEVNGWDLDERRLAGVSPSKLKLIHRLQIYSARVADSIRVVTPGLKALLVQEGVDPAKIFVVGNGTDIEQFVPMDKANARAALGFVPDILYVGFIGNLAKWQGVSTLLQSAAPVVAAVPNVKFLIGGSGPELEPLKRLAKELNIEESVIFSGDVPHGRAPTYINCFDVGVAPFIVERNQRIGLSPLKIRDYAASGVPIVASRIAGLEMVEEQGIGFLVEPENPETLAEALIKLLQDPQMRHEMGQRARAFAERELSWCKVAEEITKQMGGRCDRR
jgi:glycosyltransferase involved in cell wall biosynthesis